MKKIANILFIFLITTTVLIGQDTPWSVNTEGNPRNIIFQTNLVIGGDTISGNYVVAAFSQYSNKGENVSIGESEFDYSRGWVDTIITYDSSENETINMPTSTINGLVFKIWDKTNNCIISNVSYTMKSLGVVDSSLESTTIATDEIIITSMKAEIPTINYTSQFVCSNLNEIEPAVDADIPITYLSSDGLKIDSTTGVIYPEASKVGSYIIRMRSDYCYTVQNDSIHIVPVPENRVILDTSICEGSQLILADVAKDGFDSNRLETMGDDILDEEGVYSYGIENSYGCTGLVYVDLKLIPLPEIKLLQEDKCNSVRLRPQIRRNISYKWKYGDVVSDSTEVDIYNSTEVEVTATNPDGCESSQLVSVEVKPFLARIDDYEIKNSDCWENGSLQIKGTSFENGVYPYSFRLKNKLTGAVSNNLDDLEEGIYTLSVEDSRNCVDKLDTEMVIKEDCNENYPVFSPNEDGNEDKFFIPHKGVVQIFDRFGKMLRELEVPAYWDGRDDEGNLMPMGNYVMITEKGKAVNITIIR